MTNQYNHIRHRSRTSSTMSRRLHLGWGRILSSAARYHDVSKTHFCLVRRYDVISCCVFCRSNCKHKMQKQVICFLSMRSMSLGSKETSVIHRGHTTSEKPKQAAWSVVSTCQEPTWCPVFVSILMIGSQQGQIFGVGEGRVSDDGKLGAPGSFCIWE